MVSMIQGSLPSESSSSELLSFFAGAALALAGFLAGAGASSSLLSVKKTLTIE